MTITTRPSRGGPSLLGGSIDVPVNPCRHESPRSVDPWTGEAGTAGSVALVGAGKMGLPLAAQFAGHGWRVTAVDVNPAVVEAINAGRSHVAEEPGLVEAVAAAHASGRLRATTDGTAAAGSVDVVVVIVPVMLNDRQQPDYRYMDAAVAAIGPGLHPGSLVVFETTLPVGDTRARFAPVLEAASGLTVDEDLFVAFSPERLLSGHVFQNLATYPKLVGGIGPASTARAAAFYASVLDAEVVAMSNAEAAEFAKLAETTYRDVNIALANEFANYAERVGVDIQEVIAAANSQPYSHIHQPGIGVGGHCIPVYPHFLLSRAPEMTLVDASRKANDGQVDRAIETLEGALGGLRGGGGPGGPGGGLDGVGGGLDGVGGGPGGPGGGLDGVEVLVLGLTYRDGVRELAYSRAVPLVEGLRARGARVLAFDPLLDDDEIVQVGAVPWRWGSAAPSVRAIVTQTADPVFRSLDPGWFPDLRVILDGRNSLRELALPAGVAYHGIGVPRRSGAR